MPTRKRHFIQSSAASSDDELPEERTKRTLTDQRVRYPYDQVATTDDEAVDDASNSNDSEQEYSGGEEEGEDEDGEEDELISIGSDDESAKSKDLLSAEASIEASEEEEERQRLANLDESEGIDSDERYARMLQRQEIALAGAFFRDDRLTLTQIFETQNSSEGSDSIDMSYEALLELQENIGEVKKRGLDEQSIKSLPTITFNNKENLLTEQKSCVVCMNEFMEEDKIVKLECEHRFHLPCAKEWLLVRASCPICRSPVQICTKEVVLLD